jgi:hypothetical protein
MRKVYKGKTETEKESIWTYSEDTKRSKMRKSRHIEEKAHGVDVEGDGFRKAFGGLKERWDLEVSGGGGGVIALISL